MPTRVLIAPDKFKGTLSAQQAAEAIARGWAAARPADSLALLPMSDGGDGFGEVMARTMGARERFTRTVDAAGRPVRAPWWWEPRSGTAVVESARVIGLAMLPRGKFHPRELDTHGLGAVLRAAAKAGARRCIVGIGGSATNDGGFGLARALGWGFRDGKGEIIKMWPDLKSLALIEPPAKRTLPKEMIVAVDVNNPLLGARGCTQVYGPQKGLRAEDFPEAEAALKRLSIVARAQLGKDFARTPGAGAAGGLGFGLMTFCGAKGQSGFELFARQSGLRRRLRASDVVVTGEGALDAQTLMGKGVGELLRLCRAARVPCVGLAGVVTEPEKAARRFAVARGLVELTSVEEARREPAKWLERLALETGLRFEF